MPRTRIAIRLLVAIGLFVVLASVSQDASAQYFRPGPHGHISIRSPYLSLNVPPAYYYGPYYYGPVAPLPPVLPLPPSAPFLGYREYEFWYPYHPHRFGYSYGLYSDWSLPWISSFQLDLNSTAFSYPEDSYSVSRPPVKTNDLADELRIAAEILRQNLVARTDDGDVWLEYLNPDAVIDSLDVTKQPDPANEPILANLIGHYDGVAGNPELRYVSMTRGFEETRQLLRLWVERQSSGAIQGESANVQTMPDQTMLNETMPTETLPAPQPEPVADSAAAPQQPTRRSL